jgi:integrase
MRIYRQTTTKDGETIEVKKWYTDAYVGGKRNRLPLFESKPLSQRFADKLDAVIGEYQSGAGFSQDTQQWLSQLSPQMMQRLSKMGLVDTARAAARSDISQHLDDWRAALIAGGTGKKHADQNHHRAVRIFTEAGFRSLSDISGSKVMTTIGRLQTTIHKKNRKTGKVELTPTGPASSFLKLHHLRAVKQFTKWAVVNGRMIDNPLQCLMIKNVRVENQRRPLSVDELTYLLGYVKTAPAIWNVSGDERALIYELAVNTGLRRDEIKSLTRNSFDFRRLSVKVEAEDTKNKKPALLPVKAALMDKIKAHLTGKLPTAAAFSIPEAAAKMLCKDMTAARAGWIKAAKENPDEHRRRNESDFLKTVTHRGKVDFHSLRHTFGTLLAGAGVHPKVAMDLMRHSDINLTMSLYTHGSHDQQTAAIDSLPSFVEQEKPETKKA